MKNCFIKGLLIDFRHRIYLKFIKIKFYFKIKDQFNEFV